jgi:hypothetical protein
MGEGLLYDTWIELGCIERVCSSCSISDTSRVILTTFLPTQILQNGFVYLFIIFNYNRLIRIITIDSEFSTLIVVVLIAIYH